MSNEKLTLTAAGRLMMLHELLWRREYNPDTGEVIEVPIGIQFTPEQAIKVLQTGEIE